jgi:hypothetical protein
LQEFVEDGLRFQQKQMEWWQRFSQRYTLSVLLVGILLNPQLRESD